MFFTHVFYPFMFIVLHSHAFFGRTSCFISHHISFIMQRYVKELFNKLFYMNSNGSGRSRKSRCLNSGIRIINL